MLLLLAKLTFFVKLILKNSADANITQHAKSWDIHFFSTFENGQRLSQSDGSIYTVKPFFTGERSSVRNVSCNRCEYDCRSRGRKFDSGRVPYFHGGWSWNNFYGQPAESLKKGCCQLQVKVCARSTGQLLVQACPGKSVVRWTDRLAMTIAVDSGRKATKQTNKTYLKRSLKKNRPRNVFSRLIISITE